jgi:hypothetical protein
MAISTLLFRQPKLRVPRNDPYALRTLTTYERINVTMDRSIVPDGPQNATGEGHGPSLPIAFDVSDRSD